MVAEPGSPPTAKLHTGRSGGESMPRHGAVSLSHAFKQGLRSRPASSTGICRRQHTRSKLETLMVMIADGTYLDPQMCSRCCRGLKDEFEDVLTLRACRSVKDGKIAPAMLR